MKKVIIFGDRVLAELAHYYLTNDANREVACFTLHRDYIKETTFCGLPVIPFEEITKSHPPDQYCFIAPLYAKEMNKFKERIYLEAKSLGYEIISYISSKAMTWNATIGENCFIFEGCNIQPFVKLGNNIVIWSYTHIGHHSIVHDHVFMSGYAAIAGHNIINSYCWIGSNCTTKEFVTIPEGTLIGQDASIINSPDKPWSVWVGVPAKYLKSSIGIT